MADVLSMTNEERRVWGAETLDRMLDLPEPDDAVVEMAGMTLAEVQIVTTIALARLWVAARLLGGGE